jgi:hypothetical protein
MTLPPSPVPAGTPQPEQADPNPIADSKQLAVTHPEPAGRWFSGRAVTYGDSRWPRPSRRTAGAAGGSRAVIRRGMQIGVIM